MLVELFVSLLRDLSFSLGAGQFGNILVGFFDEFFDSRTNGIIVEELIVALFDALVNVGKVGTKSRNWLENRRSKGVLEKQTQTVSHAYL